MRLLRTAIFAALAWTAMGMAHGAPAERTLDDYRHFRTLHIDLYGRLPTRAEIASFERPDFQWAAFVDKALTGPGVVERLTRIYMDALRLEVGPAFNYAPPSTTLHRVTILGPTGRPEYVYYRAGQRRERAETDGRFCLLPEESGFEVLPNKQLKGVPHNVSAAVLAARTEVVKPWWLYRDYDAAEPMLLYKQSWPNPDPLYVPVRELLADPDGRVTVDVRVCKEEAQTNDVGTILAARPFEATPKPSPSPWAMATMGMGAAKIPKGLRPGDEVFARAHAGERVSCRSSVALAQSIDCGCGPALVDCMPGIDTGNDPPAFSLPSHVPLDVDLPLDQKGQGVSVWHKLWWSEEARRYLGFLFGGDRDFREILTGRYTLVNGPLVQFYRASEPAACCGRERGFGMLAESEPLLDPRVLPELAPSDVRTFRLVADRGPHAAGLLTMPVFLTKYASRRARGAVLYNAFLCRQFSAGNAPLSPSTEPNLMKRPGCATCHQTLEPLAAYFSRVEETSWTYLPDWQFPLHNPKCKMNNKGKIPGFCEFFYDPAFSDKSAGLLRGAYASMEHAAAGPAGAAEALTSQPEFARCAVERVTSSFLGRPLGTDDQSLLDQLTDTFVHSGYRMRALVRALVLSPIYRDANDRGGAP